MHLKIFHGGVTENGRKNTQRLNELVLNAGNYIALYSSLCNNNKTAAFLQQFLRTKKLSLKEKNMCDGMRDKSCHSRNIMHDEPKVMSKFWR